MDWKWEVAILHKQRTNNGTMQVVAEWQPKRSGESSSTTHTHTYVKQHTHTHTVGIIMCLTELTT